MSRNVTFGVNPKNQKKVQVTYGYDVVLPDVSEGFFFQVFSLDPKVLKESKDGEGILVNEGFVQGISRERLHALADEWSVEIKE